MPEEAERFAHVLRLFREGKLGEDDFRRFRLQHGIYSERFQTDFGLLRVKLPAGVITPEQLELLADLAEVFSIGSLHLTTRQNIQLHWLLFEDVPEILRRLAEAGLTTREACGNTVRNVTCCPLAGCCPHEAFDVTPYALATARYLLRNPMNQDLPRKFKINFSGCGRWCSLAPLNDVGLVAEEREDGGRRVKGFRVYVGGGLGPASYVGGLLEDFTPEDRLLETVASVIRVFDRLGDRVKMHKNRMRYLVKEMGFQKFKELVLRERRIVQVTQPANFRLSLPQASSPLKEVEESFNPAQGVKDEAYLRWFTTNVTAQKQKGYYAVYLSTPAGDMLAQQVRAVAEVARNHSEERLVRVTPLQGLVFRWIPGRNVPEVYWKLKEAGLASPGALSVASVVGCTGTASCNLAITNSHRVAKEVRKKFLELGLDMDGDLKNLAVKLSGCPNSCGHHAIGAVGLVGSTQRIEGILTPAYLMLLGGKTGLDARIGKPFMRVPAKKLPEVLVRLFELYKAEKAEGEDFHNWIDRVLRGGGASVIKNAEDLRRELEKAAKLPSPREDPKAYMDWGSEEKFVAKTARGECAA
jgi:sulfite reductase (ferredoxin)